MKTLIATVLLSAVIGNAAFAIKCKRILSILSAKEMKIEIIVNKEDISGFAKLAEVIPEGSVIKYAKSEGGSVDIANNKMNFFWLNLPNNDEIKVTYILNTDKLNEGDYDIAGKLSYVSENNPKALVLDTSIFSISATQGINLEPLASVVSKNERITYGIQIVTSDKPLPDDYFVKNYNLMDRVKINSENNLYKYVVGEFTNLYVAVEYREQLISKGLKSSNIIAFSDDKEIPLNEAKERQGIK